MKKLLSKKVNKGITLIALVITIVVLIILAGVIISITLGNGGIIDRAKTAKQEYANAEGYEQTQIVKTANEIDSITMDSTRGSYSNMFMDTSKLLKTIVESTAYTNNDTYTYTATEDCQIVGWVCLNKGTKNPTMDIYINNVRIGCLYHTTGYVVTYSINYLLKKGDTIKFDNNISNDATAYSQIYAYGLK